MIKEYFGFKCLYCQSLDILRYRPTGVQLAVDDIPQLEISCYCNSCNKDWIEIYQLIEVKS